MMQRRALSLLELLTAVVVLSLASGIALFSFLKARTHYTEAKIREEAKELLAKTSLLSFILNNEIILALVDVGNKQFIQLQATGLPEGILKQKFQTLIPLPDRIQDAHFEFEGQYLQSVRILPNYCFTNPSLEFILQYPSKEGILTASLPEQVQIANLSLPDEILQSPSVKEK